jgi:SAM-dependent methyltransferase
LLQATREGARRWPLSSLLIGCEVRCGVGCAVKRAVAGWLVCGLLLGTTACATRVDAPAPPTPALVQLRDDAKAVAPFATGAAAREFLGAVNALPAQAPRVVYVNSKRGLSLSPDQHERLAQAEAAGFERVTYDEAFYYATFYGSPVAYARALDIAAQHGVTTLDGLRLLDIGYGAIGAMRMLAAAGAQVSALDVDPLMPALYRERSDQGLVRGRDGRVGSLTLFDGVFAGDAATTRALGRHFDLIVSKNTLKRGFLKPSNGRKPVVDFGVSDGVLLAALRDALAPGGRLLIYNLGGKFDPGRPSTDGRSPFDRAQFEAAGFEVLALNANDDELARAMGQALGWQQQMGALAQNLFAQYTLVQRPAASKALVTP